LLVCDPWPTPLYAVCRYESGERAQLPSSGSHHEHFTNAEFTVRMWLQSLLLLRPVFERDDQEKL
jgi:hypothetical protein